VADFQNNHRYIINSRGKKIYNYAGLCGEDAKANLIFIHDYSLHSNIYISFFEDLNRAGFNVFGIDLEGFGKSDGIRGDIREFEYYVNDTRYFFDKIHDECSDAPTILTGHGLGALVSLQAQCYLQNELTGLILMAPLFDYSSLLPKIMQEMSRYISTVASTFPVTSIDLCRFCNKKEVLEKLEKDEFVYKGKLRARMAAHIIEQGKKCIRDLHNIDLPVLLIQGTDDTLTSNKKLCRWCEKSENNHIDLKMIDNGEHLFMLEETSYKTKETIQNWIDRVIIKEKTLS